MATRKPNPEVRAYLASIGFKGGKSVTAKKRAHLQSIATKGGGTVTPRKPSVCERLTFTLER